MIIMAGVPLRQGLPRHAVRARQHPRPQHCAPVCMCTYIYIYAYVFVCAYVCLYCIYIYIYKHIIYYVISPARL